MVGVKYLARGGYVGAVARHLVPRDRYADVEVVAYDGGLRRTGRRAAEARRLLHQLFRDLLRRGGLLYLFYVFGCVVVRFALKLGLYLLQLLAQVVIALILFDIAANLRVNLGFDAEHTDLVLDDGDQRLRARYRVEFVENLLLVFDADKRVRGDEVGEQARRFYRLRGEHHVAGTGGQKRQHLLRRSDNLAHKRLDADVASALGRYYLRHHVGFDVFVVAARYRYDAGAAQAVRYHADLAVGVFERLLYLYDDADLV